MNHILTYNDFLNETNIGNRWTDAERKTFATMQYENLLETLDAMKKYNIKCWIDCGTLLGIYRDGEIIPGDSDSDTGALVEGFKPEFVDDFANNLTIPGKNRSAIFFKPTEFLDAYNDKNSFVAPKGFKYQMRKKGRLQTFKGNPIMTDIFMYYPFKTDRIYAFGRGYFRTKDVYLQDGTKSMTADGRTYKILNRTEEHLEATYGKGWKSPDPHFKMENEDIYCGPITQEQIGGKYLYNFLTKKYKLE